jgi:L-asparaginase
MAKTARLLGENVHDKTIVLVGAMIPYMVGNSDALFNLGSAITAVQLLDNGVYVTMNGKIFSWDNVTKNKDIAEFVTLS